MKKIRLDVAFNACDGFGGPGDCENCPLRDVLYVDTRPGCSPIQHINCKIGYTEMTCPVEIKNEDKESE